MKTPAKKTLLIGLIGATLISCIYSYNKSKQYNSLNKEYENVVFEKKIMEDKLAKIIENYKNANNKNKQLSKKVVSEINQIITLKKSVDTLDKSIETEKKLANNKAYLAKNLSDENKALYNQINYKENLTEHLSNKNKALNDEINKVKGLKTSSFETRSMRKKINGTFTSTSNTNKIDAFKVSFKIKKNTLADSGKKNIYIQIINPKKEIIAFKHQTKVNNTIIPYSDKLTINYNKESLNITSLIEVNRENIYIGQYEVITYVDDQLLNKSIFTLN